MNLAAEMAKLPEPPNDSKPPLWDAWRYNLWRRAQDDDPHNFAKWPAVYHTMLVDHWFPDVMRAEVDYVWRALPMDIDTSTPQARNLIHQLYHLLRWEEATGKTINQQLSIYEFGGGYGAMAQAAKMLGFKGKYYIYDLPEFALLQRWYLEESGVNNVEWRSEFVITDVDLLIACYSLSETDLEERARFLITTGAQRYLFLYSNKFEQYDNLQYFQQDVPSVLTSRNWRHEHIAHLPPESWYSWGW